MKEDAPVYQGMRASHTKYKIMGIIMDLHGFRTKILHNGQCYRSYIKRPITWFPYFHRWKGVKPNGAVTGEFECAFEFTAIKHARDALVLAIENEVKTRESKRWRRVE